MAHYSIHHDLGEVRSFKQDRKDGFDYIKNRNICLSKDAITKILTIWEKILTHTTEKVLISTIYKECLHKIE